MTNVFSITGHSSPIYVSVVFLVYVSEPQIHMTNEVRFEFQNSLSSPNSRNTPVVRLAVTVAVRSENVLVISAIHTHGWENKITKQLNGFVFEESGR